MPSEKSVAKFFIYESFGKYVLTQFIKYSSSPYFDITYSGVIIKSSKTYIDIKVILSIKWYFVNYALSYKIRMVNLV